MNIIATTPLPGITQLKTDDGGWTSARIASAHHSFNVEEKIQMATIGLWEGMNWEDLNTVLTGDWKGMNTLKDQAIRSLNETLVASRSLEEVKEAFLKRERISTQLVGHVTPEEWVEISYLANKGS